MSDPVNQQVQKVGPWILRWANIPVPLWGVGVGFLAGVFVALISRFH